MSLKSNLAISIGRTSYIILNKFGGGSSLPGKIAYNIDPDILGTLGENYEVIIVTGTNGKTLTTSLTNKILYQKYDDILTNPSGSNMIQGIVTAFLSYKPKTDKPIALLEVDEANVKTICQYLKPKYFILTNIFRDQMDRYGEIYTTYQKIIDGIKLAPEATVIANGDAPIFNSNGDKAITYSDVLPNKFIYYGFTQEGKDKEEITAPTNTDGVLCTNCNHILRYHYITYANLGDYYCPNCDKKRPDLKYSVNKVSDLTPNSSKFQIDNYDYSMNIGGMYNIYNALAAYSLGREYGVTQDQIADAFNENNAVFGRQEKLTVEDKELSIILVKNPVGLNQVFQTISTDKDNFSLGFLLNANYADGTDTSWIWDGEFEELPYDRIDKIMTGGERRKDITLRFKVSDAPEEKLTEYDSIDDFIETIKKVPSKKVYALASYTAMLELRKKLKEKKYIK